MMAGQDAVVHHHLLHGGIFIRRNDQVDAILEILMDDLDPCSLAIKYQIERVGTALFGMQADTIPCSYLLTSNSYRFWRWVILAWEIPTLTTHHSFSPSLIGRSSRIAPCSFMNCSGVRTSVRSNISRVRSSCRICSFSSSVSVMIRKLRISSISVPSKRAPGLSGAVCGESYKMMGEDSIASRSPSLRTNTGQVCRV